MKRTMFLLAFVVVFMGMFILACSQGALPLSSTQTGVEGKDEVTKLDDSNQSSLDSSSDSSSDSCVVNGLRHKAIKACCSGLPLNKRQACRRAITINRQKCKFKCGENAGDIGASLGSLET